ATRLIEAALETVGTKGVAGASSRDIAAAEGVNLQAITYHFGSKEDLVAGALLRAVRAWVEPVLAILRRDEDPATRMFAAAEALQRSLEEARVMVPVYLEAIVHSRRNEPLREGLEALVGELRRFLRDQITELRAGGYLPSWVDPDAMAMLLVAVADG